MLGRTPLPARAGWHQMNVLQTGWQRVRSLSHGRDGGVVVVVLVLDVLEVRGSELTSRPLERCGGRMLVQLLGNIRSGGASGASAPAAVFPLISWRGSPYSR